MCVSSSSSYMCVCDIKESRWLWDNGCEYRRVRGTRNLPLLFRKERQSCSSCWLSFETEALLGGHVFYLVSSLVLMLNSSVSPFQFLSSLSFTQHQILKCTLQNVHWKRHVGRRRRRRRWKRLSLHSIHHSIIPSTPSLPDLIKTMASQEGKWKRQSFLIQVKKYFREDEMSNKLGRSGWNDEVTSEEDCKEDSLSSTLHPRQSLQEKVIEIWGSMESSVFTKTDRLTPYILTNSFRLVTTTFMYYFYGPRHQDSRLCYHSYSK